MRISLKAVFLTALFASPAFSSPQFDMNEFLGFAPYDPRPVFADTPKTIFQTNNVYDPMIDISVDAVIVHRHGDSSTTIKHAIETWSAKGHLPHRMFFADSDAGNFYTQGKFDGKNHPDDIEKTSDGKDVLCSGIRPYMVPTEGWTAFLKSKVKESIDAGAKAIYPEEPLTHLAAGYSQSIKDAYEKEYSQKWVAPHSSPDALFKIGRLKSKLYTRLEQTLADYTAQYAKETQNNVEFYIPIHSMFSNKSVGLIAPLGNSLSIKGHDGYIGQIWTAPVNWTMMNYSNKNVKFFDSAYVNYDFFVNLVDYSNKKLYLLADPVEDTPDYTWDQYEAWYKECLAAKLMFPTIDTYEVMPWPDRIFLPGFNMGGGKTPGPAHYRTILMSVLTALQDIPKGTYRDLQPGQKGIGMLIGDSAMWQTSPKPPLDAFLSLLMPPLKKGIPVSTVPIERFTDENYIKNFKLLLLSYEGFKPELEAYHDNLVKWVNTGGTLILFETKDEFDNIDMFWNQAGFPTPQSHLLNKFDIDHTNINANTSHDGQFYFHKPIGRGHLIVSKQTPSNFTNDNSAQKYYMPLLRTCAKKYTTLDLKEPGYITANRGNFKIIHTFETKKKVPGTFLDIYNENLPVVSNITLKKNTSAILYRISDKLQGPTPKLLYATYRLMGKKETDTQTAFFIRGPAETQGCARLFSAGKKIASIEARTTTGKSQKVSILTDSNDTVLIKFPYDPQGLGIKITWN